MIAAVAAAAAVIAAGVVLAVMVVVVIAAHIGIVQQLALDQCLHGCVGLAAAAAEEADAGLCQRHLCAAADTAADQHIGMDSLQHAGQRAVAAAHGVHHFGVGDDTGFVDVVDLELCRVAEMLEDLSVFVGYCNFNDKNPPWEMMICPYDTPFCRPLQGCGPKQKRTPP